MKKTVILCSAIVALLLASCQSIFTPTAAPGPTGNSAATEDSLFRTAVAQTLTAQPSPTLLAFTDTATLPADTATLPPTDVVPATSTPTLAADLSATPATATFGVATATSGPVDTTSTATLAVGQVTAVWTLAVRTYGTLPPEVPFGQITLVNKAKTEAYISLQVTMPDGKYSIIEYPVEGSVEIQAPVGQYLYVTWVGGRKMVGEFRLHKAEDLTINLFRNRVEIK